MKKVTLLLTSIISSSLLVGGTLAAFAVTDNAGAITANVSPGDIEHDDADYRVLNWGSSTSLLPSLGNVAPGSISKIGVISLQSNANYVGVLSLDLEDQTPAKPTGTKKFIDYVKLYLYQGNNNDLEEGVLPSGTPLISTNLGEYSATYDEALGTATGKEYSIYLEYVSAATPYNYQMSSDVINLTIDWSPQAEHITDDYHTIYLASNWPSAYLFSWTDGKESNANYPGKELSKMGVNEYGQYIYKGLLKSTHEKMIFSNGYSGTGNQTADILTSTFNFSSGDLLFWLNDDNSNVGGTVVFEDSMITSTAANMAENPGTILQAFSWTTSKVQQELDHIKAAGFNAVQLSPLQPIGGGSSTNDCWYMVYQPIGFTVANSGENPLGTKASLQSLTAAAKEKGIDIYVDVVANHLAGNGNGGLNNMVASRENIIYSNNLIHNVGNFDGSQHGDNVQMIVQGAIGMPDLKTEDSRVQLRVISLLKEYIDCGVTGFRFDAAKHIETAQDGQYASDFWQNVLSEVNSYAIKNYGIIPYSYGEVLGVSQTPGVRSWAGYTDVMDVTDDGMAWNIREKWNNSDEGGLASGLNNYNVGEAKHAVNYGETHDNYVGDGHDTTFVDSWKMNAIYGLYASRASSNALYFPRPSSSDIYGTSGDIHYTRIVVNNPITDYYGSVVSAANKLHNDFNGGTEYLSAYGGCVLNARQLGDNLGVYIANPDGASNVSVQVQYASGVFPAGSYRDLVTGTVYNFNSSTFNVNLTNGVAVLEKI